MNNDKLKIMQERATRRRDGVFSMGPYSLYAVLKNNLVGYAEFIGPESYDIYQLSFGFAHKSGEAEDKAKAINLLEYLIFNIEN